MIRPLGDRIAVKLMPSSNKIGLLFITDATKSTRNQLFRRAKVVAHGKDVEQATTGLTVVVSEYFGDEVEVDGEKLRVGRERDITGIDTLDGIYPVGDRVLIEVIPPRAMFGLIHLPEDVRSQQIEGRVVAAGIDCTVVKGDRILIPKSLSVKVNLDGKEYLLLEEPAVLTIL